MKRRTLKDQKGGVPHHIGSGENTTWDYFTCSTRRWERTIEKDVAKRESRNDTIRLFNYKKCQNY